MASPYPVVFIPPEHTALLEAIGAADPATDTTATLSGNLQVGIRTIKRMFPALLDLGLIQPASKGSKMEYVLSEAGSSLMESASASRAPVEEPITTPAPTVKVARAHPDADILSELGITLDRAEEG